MTCLCASINSGHATAFTGLSLSRATISEASVSYCRWKLDAPLPAACLTTAATHAIFCPLAFGICLLGRTHTSRRSLRVCSTRAFRERIGERIQQLRDSVGGAWNETRAQASELFSDVKDSQTFATWRATLGTSTAEISKSLGFQLIADNAASKVNKAQGKLSEVRATTLGLLHKQVNMLQDRLQGVDLEVRAQETVSNLMGLGKGALPAELESGETEALTSQLSELVVALAAQTSGRLEDGLQGLSMKQLKAAVAEVIQPLEDMIRIPQDRQSLRGIVVSAAARLLQEAQTIPEGRPSLRGAIKDLTPEEREKKLLDRFCSHDGQQRLEQIYLPAAYFSLRAYEDPDVLHQVYAGFEDFEVIGSSMQRSRRTFNLDAIRAMAPNFVISLSNSVTNVQRFQGSQVEQEVCHHIIWGICKHSPTTLVIAQRGTDNEGDWLYNLSNFPRSFPNDQEDDSAVSNMVVMSAQHELDSLDIKVAFGFWRKYRDVRRKFWEDLEVSQRSRPDIFENIDTVVFAGHSLGGAAAIYMAADALKTLYFPNVKSFRTVTFGAPPAAGPSFFSEFYFNNNRNPMPLPLEHTSFVHTRDAVATVASTDNWVRSPGEQLNLGPIRIGADSLLGIGPLGAHRMAYYLERVQALKQRSRQLVG